MSALYPDVPDAPGVPPVLRQSGGNLAVDVALLTADVLIGLSGLFLSQWGIFDASGAPAFIGDAVLGVDFRDEARVSDFPLEAGAFASYNKVDVPFDVRVTFAISADLATRAGFLADLRAAKQSLDLFTVMTPEAVYPSANIVHYDYRRQTRGAVSRIDVDVWLQEIRITAAAQFSNSQDPAAADPVDGGTVTPTPSNDTPDVNPNPPHTPSAMAADGPQPLPASGTTSTPTAGGSAPAVLGSSNPPLPEITVSSAPPVNAPTISDVDATVAQSRAMGVPEESIRADFEAAGALDLYKPPN